MDKKEAIEKARELDQKIDLSKAHNLSATGAVDPEINNIVAKPKKPGRFDFSEIRTVRLPSRGYLYKGYTNDKELLNGNIQLKSMTVAEEKILSTQRYLKAGITTRVILDRCILSGIDAKDILLYDSNYLMFYLRQISYGDDYTFEITCPDATCEKKFKHTVKISELDFEEIPENIEEPIVVNLPSSKYTVKMMLTRLHHLEKVSAKDRNTMKSSNVEDNRLINTLVETTKEVLDNNGEKVPMGYWEEFYEAIPGIDRAAITDAVNHSTGIDSIDNVACPYCNANYDGLINIDANFFRI